MRVGDGRTSDSGAISETPSAWSRSCRRVEPLRCMSKALEMAALVMLTRKLSRRRGSVGSLPPKLGRGAPNSEHEEKRG